jgi:hypothetical protein
MAGPPVASVVGKMPGAASIIDREHRFPILRSITSDRRLALSRNTTLVVARWPCCASSDAI